MLHERIKNLEEKELSMNAMLEESDHTLCEKSVHSSTLLIFILNLFIRFFIVEINLCTMKHLNYIPYSIELILKIYHHTQFSCILIQNICKYQYFQFNKVTIVFQI